MLDRLLECLLEALMAFFMPLVCLYFAVTVDPFVNVSLENASGLEKVSNTLLAPTQYIFAGRTGTLDQEGRWNLKQRFDYKDHFWPRTCGSVVALPPSLVAGCLVKALSFLSEDTKERYRSLKHFLKERKVSSNRDRYIQMGMKLENPEYALYEPGGNHQRRPGDEYNLRAEKEALKEIAKVLNEENIPWWIDCGTCLGSYRYGGVIPWDFDIDIALLLPDYENAEIAFQRLDPSKYIVQNWSSRDNPNTYFKVYVRETGRMIDVYFFTIDEEKKEISYLLSLETHMFFPDWWKQGEQPYKIPVAFDTVFPLKKTLFDGIEVFVPNHSEKYLQRYYGENLAPVKTYNSETCRYEKDPTHPYWHRS